MMSTYCSKHVEAWNKYIKKECVKLVINQNYVKMHGQQNIKLGFKISMIINTKPDAGWRNGGDETCFWVELTVPQQTALKYVGRTLFRTQVRVQMCQNRPCDP
jgi:hypothetical protein